MKKLLLIMITTFSTILLFGCDNTATNSDGEGYMGDFTEGVFEDIRLSGQKSITIFVSDECSSCLLYLAEVDKAAKKLDIPIVAVIQSNDADMPKVIAENLALTIPIYRMLDGVINQTYLYTFPTTLYIDRFDNRLLKRGLVTSGAFISLANQMK